MADQRVPVLQTTPSMLDFARALLRAWRAEEGSLPTKEQTGVLWAHFAGETGDGRHCYNYNLGNWKRVAGEPYMALAGVWEGVTPAQAEKLIASGHWAADPNPGHAVAVGPGKVSVVATKENPAAWFRAYASLEAGMAAFVAHKRNPKSRYASAWKYVVAGDPDKYARELGKRGYYTADPDVYARALVTKHKAWMVSDAFDEALAELVAASEAVTLPELPEGEPDTEPQPTVHAAPDFEPRSYDFDEDGHPKAK